jgi:hypothetical protein
MAHEDSFLSRKNKMSWAEHGIIVRILADP